MTLLADMPAELAMTSHTTLGIIGCTGLVGATLCRILGERAHEFSAVRLFDTTERSGQVMAVRGAYHRVTELAPGALQGVDVAICALPERLARPWLDVARDAGITVVDCSGAHREDQQVPLISADVNLETLDPASRVVTSPHSVVVAAATALAPLHQAWGLTDVNITALVPASAHGRQGVERLHSEMTAVAGSRDLGSRAGDVRARLLDSLEPDSSPFAAPLVFNVSSWVGAPSDEPVAGLERAVMSELHRLLDAPDLRLNVTCLQVPVLVGETLSVDARCSRPVSTEAARTALVTAPGIVVLDDPSTGDLPTPIDAVGSAPAFVGRIRQHPDAPRGVSFVQCSDNLRSGSALNAIRIAEALAGGVHPA